MLVQRLDESLEAPPAKVSEVGVCARLIRPDCPIFVSLYSKSLILNLFESAIIFIRDTIITHTSLSQDKKNDICMVL